MSKTDKVAILLISLGEELASATVTEQSILGGATKTAFAARWEPLHTGALPDGNEPPGRLVAEVDVADLESEARARTRKMGVWCPATG